MPPDFNGNDILLGEMTSVVCHEINNSLNGITLQVALMEQSAPEESRSGLSNIQKLARQAADLVKKLQHCNRDKIERQPVDINELARTVRSALQERYPEAQIKLDLVAGPCNVLADTATLERILSLLGRHSVSVASTAKPQIMVTTRTDGRRCFLTWHDNGPAAADGDLERLFEPFHCVREGSDEVSLPITRLLARRMYCAISAVTDPAGGMNFILELSPA